jgi:hypothetical protein
VTLHDVEITQAAKEAGADELQLSATVKTYRYLDEEEQVAAQPPSGGKPSSSKKPSGKQPPKKRPRTST